MAYGQRVRKRHPEGGLSGLGISPSRRWVASTAAASSPGSFGIEASRARVYGCRGFAYSFSELVISTAWPRYITSTLSLMYWTTFRS